MPDTIDKALNMAIIVTNADNESGRSCDGGAAENRRVFAVAGSREDTPFRPEEIPMEWKSR
jgi:hypothetical protein